MSLVGKVKLETAWLPTFEVDAVSTGEQPWLARTLRPRLTVETVAGPMTWTPAGAPGENRWPLLVAALVGVAMLALYGLARLLGK